LRLREQPFHQLHRARAAHSIVETVERGAQGLDVVLITSEPPVLTPDEIVAEIPLRWRIPDAVAAIPFAPGSAAPISSVEMALHYLWLRHLVATQKR
jgi:hypothetical protein